MPTEPRLNRAAQIALFTKMISGVNLHVMAAILLGGQTYSASQIVAVFSALLQANTDLDAARVAYHQKLVAHKAALQSADGMGALLKSYVQGAYGKHNPILGDFGFSFAVPTPKTVKVKAAAALKSAATREARGTRGSKQKAAIHGTVPSTDPVAIPPVSPATTPLQK